MKYNELGYNTSFENVNLFQCDWYIKEQFKYNWTFTFAYYVHFLFIHKEH